MVDKPAKKRAKKVPRAGKKGVVPPETLPSHPKGIVNVYNLEGGVDHSVELPSIFFTDFRPDLIRRAVLSFRANRRQPYGPNPRSGMRHSVRWSGKGQGVSRVPRIRGTMKGAEAPGTKSGRRAHPPRPERIWTLKINVKEKRKARDSALSAMSDPSHVRRRGHHFNSNMTLPLVVLDDIESITTTKEALDVLRALGVIDDIVRSKDRTKIRAGRGKMRGRRFRSPRSLLLVVSDAGRNRRGFGNLPGIEVQTPANLNVEMLAPGGDPGRLAVFSEAAFEKLRSW